MLLESFLRKLEKEAKQQCCINLRTLERKTTSPLSASLHFLWAFVDLTQISIICISLVWPLVLIQMTFCLYFIRFDLFPTFTFYWYHSLNREKLHIQYSHSTPKTESRFRSQSIFVLVYSRPELCDSVFSYLTSSEADFSLANQITFLNVSVH